ncbi:MAG: hypothetical protein EOO92_22530 [Pedobacter sp.]|nr:MAG: hypothetical protein EOO92_22530 [Pedobacter sp.]
MIIPRNDSFNYRFDSCQCSIGIESQVISEKTYWADQVTYMSDKLGLHRISNPDKENYAVSLHRESTMLRPNFALTMYSVHTT